MTFRPHGRKPTLALWMLVALADVAILMTTAGVLSVLLVAAIVAGAVLAPRLLRRGTPPPRPVTHHRALREGRAR
jgi:Flp pilus assembly protein TadB